MELISTSQLNELIKFIKGKPDSRELKRAIAVKLALQKSSYSQIESILNVSSAFISKWKTRFFSQGREGLYLKYKGAKPLLNSDEKQAIIEWLQQKDYWNLKELYSYILINYDISFKSKQSYYDLFREAGISWKKSQKKNPKGDPELVKKKKRRNNREITRMATKN